MSDKPLTDNTSTDNAFLDRIRMPGNPVADPATTVVRGHARFTVLTERLVRLEWSSSGEFENRATFAFPNRAASVPRFEVSESEGVLLIDTGALQLRYTLDSGPFSAANLSITFDLNGESVTWRPGVESHANLRGTWRTLDGASTPVRLSQGLVSRDGWYLYDDSRSVLFTEDGSWVAPRRTHDLQDWYFFGYGHAYTEALGEYTRFGLPVPLIPRFVLGSWWSRYWAYSADDLEQLVNDFAAHDLPLDVLVIDMDWHTPDSWTGYTWNRELFPDPEAFLRWAHERGLRVTLNLHPAEGVQSFEGIYPRFARAMGVDPATRQPIPFRPGDRRFVQNYFELLHHTIEDQGVDFWWIDWQQGEEASDIAGLDPLIWLNHLHFHDSRRRGLRPMLYSRWGGLGNHRYHIGFSGDTYAVWPILRFLPYMTSTASNIAYGWWSHDIGGHFGPDTPEQFVRWVQFGAMSPVLRLHSSKDAASERRPWAFPSPVLEIARDVYHWRYAILPYLYTMARVASDTAVSLCRPLYYEYPEHDAAYLARDQYFLGDQMIAAPVARPVDADTGLAPVDMWVPPGTWIDYDTLETFTGPRWVRLAADLARMPRLVREGAILPLAHPASTTDALPQDHLIVQVYPGVEGAFRLYEDDGTTEAYLDDQYEWTPLAMRTDEEGTCHLQIGPTDGLCDALPTARGYEVRFMGTLRPDNVLIDGEEADGWSYDEATQTTLVPVPLTEKLIPVSISVLSASGLSALTAERNRECIIADVRRLLGSAYPRAEWDDLMGAVLSLDHPRREDAVARLGGPFAQVLEEVTMPEAGQHLGSVVLVPPADGTLAMCNVLWSLHTARGTETHSEELSIQGEDQILWSPFAFEGRAQPLSWEVEVTLRWRDNDLTFRHASTTLCPSITAWWASTHNPLLEGDRLDPLNPSDSSLDWHIYEQDPLAVDSLAEPFYARLGKDYSAVLDGGPGPVIYAGTTITADREREVLFVYDAPGTMLCWLNGQQIREASEGEAPAAALYHLPMTRQPKVTAPVRLRAGQNTLVLALTPEEETDAHDLYLTASVRDPDGTVATGLSFSAEGGRG